MLWPKTEKLLRKQNKLNGSSLYFVHIPPPNFFWKFEPFGHIFFLKNRVVEKIFSEKFDLCMSTEMTFDLPLFCFHKARSWILWT